ncbi:MAG: class II aldolase/adducin family protein [Sulfurospirillaceae bacterium]|nr:class II aldolase/adducin family protein [Sulfurospirillaceae bacterium]
MLDLRIKTSRLMGLNQDLVLHGGGNTSLKEGNTIYVKASGFNLDTIDEQGFAPVSIDKLLDLLQYDTLSDTDMVRLQREAMSDQSFSNPSIEAVLHALIPFKYVDHTHADAIVTISNAKNGKRILSKLYGKHFLIVPYVMPGFMLAKVVSQLTCKVDWAKLEGIILMHHGVFTFDNHGMKSYQKMLKVVKIAEDYLQKNTAIKYIRAKRTYDLEKLQTIMSECKGYAVEMVINQSKIAQTFASMKELNVSQKGVLTPEHIIRTKRVPIILRDNYEKEILKYIKKYIRYFEKYKTDELMLNPAPNWAVLEGFGTVSFGKTLKEAEIIRDINEHTMKAMLRAEQLGGYKSLSLKDSFAMEYWELEQAKLRG